ncbi:MAG: glycosyltransferase [Candidatus Gastranaerophilales bacterium]|nr:glycosyltransferase [Candidatus Gastranaerophilales bacterium]
MKKVSVIIPCYNQGKYIKEAVNSAKKSSYLNIEIVVIDDCSTDNSSEIIKEIKDIVFIQNKENLGVSASRNKAIENSTGDYILPLDADDKIAPEYIELAAKVLDENQKTGIVYCNAQYFGKHNKPMKIKPFNKKDFIYGNCIFNCALFRKSDFMKAGKYRENMRYGNEDWDLWLSFIELGLDVYKIPKTLFCYRKHFNPSRTKTCLKNIEETQKQIIKNHLNLYLENEDFASRVFYNPEKNIKKYKKYKKLYLIALILFILALFGNVYLSVLLWTK